MDKKKILLGMKNNLQVTFCSFLVFLFISFPAFALENSIQLDKKKEITLEYRKMYSQNGDCLLAGTNFFILKKFVLKNKSENPIEIIQSSDLYKKQMGQFSNQGFKPDLDYDICLGIIFPVFLPIVAFDLIQILLNKITDPISYINFAIKNYQYSSEKLVNRPIRANEKINVYTIQKCPDEKCIVPFVDINIKDIITDEIITITETENTKTKRKKEIYTKYY